MDSRPISISNGGSVRDSLCGVPHFKKLLERKFKLAKLLLPLQY
jgi:hypothetical protein